MRPQMLNFAVSSARPRAQDRSTSVALRLILVFVLGLALGLVGGSRAIALVHQQGVGSMVICSAGFETTIYLDATGTPVQAPMDCSKCPECMNNSTHPPISVIAPSAPDALHSDAYVPSAETFLLPLRHLRPQPRGPPLVALVLIDTAPFAVRLPLWPTTHVGFCNRIERAFLDARS